METIVQRVVDRGEPSTVPLTRAVSPGRCGTPWTADDDVHGAG